MSSGDWTEDLFDADYTRVWGFPGPDVTAAEVDALSTILPAPPARVLDVACGNGRHSIGLAARGYEVTGVGVAAPFLALAREAAIAAGVSVDFRRTDMRERDTRSATIRAAGGTAGARKARGRSYPPGRRTTC